MGSTIAKADLLIWSFPVSFADSADIRFCPFAGAASVCTFRVTAAGMQGRVTGPVIENVDWPEIRNMDIAADKLNVNDTSEVTIRCFIEISALHSSSM